MPVISNPVKITIEGKPSQSLIEVLDKCIITTNRLKDALVYVRHELEKQEGKKIELGYKMLSDIKELTSE